MSYVALMFHRIVPRRLEAVWLRQGDRKGAPRAIFALPSQVEFFVALTTASRPDCFS